MLRSFFLYFFIFYSTLSFAQLEPKKIENNDLRGNKEIFSINFKLKNKVHHYYVSITGTGDYLIGQLENEKLLKRVKVDSTAAKSFDDNFVDKFINMKYMMDQVLKDKCSDQYTLHMRGEDLKVCPDDSARVVIVNELIELFKGKLI